MSVAVAHPPSGAEPVAWSQMRARVSGQHIHGTGHYWLDLELPASFGAPRPGQFVQILLEHPAPVLLPRPMSVASARVRGNRLGLGFLYAPVGAGTRALARLAPGSFVEVLGPLGRGYPLHVPGAPLLVAGGRGVAPLLFAADALRALGRRCTFLFGARSRDLLVGLEDCRRTVARLGGALHLATDDGSRGLRGTVVDLLDRVAQSRDAQVIHACGPHAMLKAVAWWGLRRGVPTYLATESVMACGTGVCRGCPLPRSADGSRSYTRQRGDAPSLYGNRDYAMCCTEGPVFGAEDLDWERVE